MIGMNGNAQAGRRKYPYERVLRKTKILHADEVTYISRNASRYFVVTKG
jgi:hypothetical protein